MGYKHEQKLLTEVPVGGRFLTKLDLEHRRFFVLKHYQGYKMVYVDNEYPLADKDGKLTGEIGHEKVLRKDPNVVIPRCRVKYISHYEARDQDPNNPGRVWGKVPIWVETVWDSEGMYVIYQNPIGDEAAEA